MRRFLLPMALALAATLPACASRQLDGSSASEAHVESADPTNDFTTTKVYEGPAFDSGATGVDRWSLYASLVEDKSGVVAYGTNADGLVTAVVVADLDHGSISAFERTSRDGSQSKAVKLPAYAKEMHEVLLAAAHASDPKTEALGAVDRATSCAVGAVLTPILAVALVDSAFVAAETVPAGLAAMAIIGASTSLAGGALADFLDHASVTASGVSEELKAIGQRLVGSARECLTGTRPIEPKK